MPPLNPDELRIVIARTDLHDACSHPLFSTLNPEEQARALAFRFEEHRRRYAASHIFLRGLIAQLVGSAAKDLTFKANSHGKPALADPSQPDLRFNLSHSGDFAICVLGYRRETGADIERMRSIEDPTGIMASHFSPPEIARILELGSAERDAAFFACWTRKEAYIKARGLGLSIPLNSFEVDVDPFAPAGEFRPVFEREHAGAWICANLDVPHGYAGAVAIEGLTPVTLTMFEWALPAKL